jgi:hypothetical protein
MTIPPLLEALRRLRSTGWTVQELATPEPLPQHVQERYAWLPDNIRQFVEAIELAFSANEKTWLLTVRDFASASNSAFVWNEWEVQSLDATSAVADRARIVTFWDKHFPLLMSVRSGYAYLAVEKDSLAIVEGTDPEFEEGRLIAGSALEIFQRMLAADRAKTPWA